MKKRKIYTANQKVQTVLELLKEGESMAQISAEYGFHPNQRYRWKKQGVSQFHEVVEDRQKEARQAEQDHQKKLDRSNNHDCPILFDWITLPSSG